MKPIFCTKDGSWKRQLEKRLEEQPTEHVTLLALGNVKFDVLAYLNRHNNLQIIKMETKKMKDAEKGVGLKISVIKKT
jgi:hypothetical protein